MSSMSMCRLGRWERFGERLAGLGKFLKLLKVMMVVLIMT